jgi:hypothetical protein
LKHFKEIKNFAFGESELPCLACEMGFNGGDWLLRWKAEFAEELRSYVTLGATSFQRRELS